GSSKRLQRHCECQSIILARWYSSRGTFGTESARAGRPPRRAVAHSASSAARRGWPCARVAGSPCPRPAASPPPPQEQPEAAQRATRGLAPPGAGPPQERVLEPTVAHQPRQAPPARDRSNTPRHHATASAASPTTGANARTHAGCAI